VQFDAKLSRSLLLPPPPSRHHTRVSRADSSLGGGAPARTTTAREIPEAEALLEGALAAIKDHPCRTVNTSLQWTVFATASE
jgi:hypothetical protein